MVGGGAVSYEQVDPVGTVRVLTREVTPVAALGAHLRENIF